MADEKIELNRLERLEAARTEVRRAVASDTVALIHPFDMCFLLKNPTVMDAVLINLFDRQFVVVDGTVYEQVNTVRNSHKLNDMMAPPPGRDVEELAARIGQLFTYPNLPDGDLVAECAAILRADSGATPEEAK